MSDCFHLGAHHQPPDRCAFHVWAPHAEALAVRFVSPEERIVPLQRTEEGYHQAVIPNVVPGARYFYRFPSEVDRPDPAGRHQPNGVHGPTEVVDPSFAWGDQDWRGIPLGDYIVYEFHIGTFTHLGTFEAVIEHLSGLKELGVNAIELMPVAQFPGRRNWGYDGVLLFAVQNSYGGPIGLKRLVNACHGVGLSVILDVVYNHVGPEGNYLAEFGPYFSDAYKTAWGPSFNFDGPECHHVRRFFVENALTWLDEFHIDALRLDAVHAIKDFSAIPFLQELAEAVHSLAGQVQRPLHLIAESDLNDSRVISKPERGGFGLHAQWSDDFHHSLHVLLTGDRSGYYEDFNGLESLARVWREGYAFSGQYSPHRRRPHGNSPKHNDPSQFLVCSQNHDQIGNRLLGERLTALVPFEKLKLAAAAVLLSPFLPMLFMGEEYGETAPFHYFVDHSDLALIEAVRRGRREEFAAFQWAGQGLDPQEESTFAACKLNRSLLDQPNHRALYEFYRELMALRKSLPIWPGLKKSDIHVAMVAPDVLGVRYSKAQDQVFCGMNFSDREVSVPVPHLEDGAWGLLVDSASKRWRGPGSKMPARIDAPGGISFGVSPASMVLLRKLK